MRWIIWILLTLVVALVLLVGALMLLPGEKIAQVAADQIRAATGREVSFDGEVSLSFYPVLGVKTGPIRVANADWSDKGPMLSAKGMAIGVEIGPILSGQIKVRRLVLEAPELMLERSRSGRYNWEIAAAESGSGGRGFAVGLGEVRIDGGRVRYLDHSDGSRHDLSGVNVVLRAPDMAGRADIEISGDMGAGAVRLSGHIDGLLPFLDGKTVPMAVDVAAKGGNVRFDGRGNGSGAAEGSVKLDLNSTAGFAAALGMGDVAPPDGLGRAIGLTGRIVVTGGADISLRDMQLRLDGNRLSGQMDMKTGGDRPMVVARLSAGDLDLSALAGDDGGNSAGAGWSKARIDASALGVVNARARLTATSINLGSLRLGASDISVGLERSRAVFTLNKVAAYGGSTTGEFVVNNRGGLSVGGKLCLKGVDVQPLLKDAAKITRIGGRMDSTLSFLGAGASLDAIMRSLKGQGSLSIPKGQIVGFDLDKLMATGSAKGGNTDFLVLTAGFTMSKGNLMNDDLSLTLPGISTTGKGRVGIGAQDIDYSFVPNAKSARKGRGLAIPVRLKGPWSDVSIRPDMKAAIDLNLQEEKKKLEEKAKAKADREVKKVLKKKLGVDVEDGQKAEDAVKKKLEDELKKGLLKVLK